MIKKVIAILTTACMAISIAACRGDATQSTSDDSEQVVIEMVESINNKEWDVFTDLMCSDEQEYYENYFQDDSYDNGVKQIETATLERTISLNIDVIEDELLTTEYPILENNDDLNAYIIELDCKVNKENQYFYDGINYFLVVLAKENGEMKVVQFNRPSLETLKNTVEPVLSENDENYLDEMAGIYMNE
jgi:hypothetical protein